jgi:phage baseplate assembly protein V
MSSDFARILANLIRFGTVKAVTTKPARVRVQVGGLLTAPLPWFSVRAATKKVRHWSPPAVGEQVIVFSPNGDPASGVALAGIYSDANPPPEGATEDNVIVAFGDGAVLLYDLVAHVLRGTLPDGGRVEVAAPGGFLLTGDTVVDGNLTVTKNVDVDGDTHVAGTVTGDTDVLAAGISGKGHTHAGVTAGAAKTAPPG